MYPAVTVALAGLFLDERMASRQVIGLAIAGVSVALIALG
jgi:drug/metabolite transporter (DMT)-like permease